jgi:hypothetical protein
VQPYGGSNRYPNAFGFRNFQVNDYGRQVVWPEQFDPLPPPSAWAIVGTTSALRNMRVAAAISNKRFTVVFLLVLEKQP